MRKRRSPLLTTILPFTTAQMLIFENKSAEFPTPTDKKLSLFVKSVHPCYFMEIATCSHSHLFHRKNKNYNHFPLFRAAQILRFSEYQKQWSVTFD